MKRLMWMMVFALYMVPVFCAVINVPADYSTIQLAIDNATAGDTVIVQPGTYAENISFKGKTNLTVRSSVMTMPEYYIIDGSQTATVVRFTGNEDASTILWGFTITNGYNAGGGGGGIRCEGGASPTIVNNIIGYNACAGSGGGIWCGEDESSPKITANLIHNNHAEDGNGGAIYAQGYMDTMVYVDIPVIRKNIIVNNVADNNGGGIFCGNYSAPIIDENALLGNHAENNGGAVAAAESRPQITNNRITNNISDYAGGGIFFTSLVFTDCEIYDIKVNNNLITCNTSDEGGGVGVYYPATGIMEFSYNTLSLNSADSVGGGIYYESGGNVDAFLNIRDTIIWENMASNGFELYMPALNQKFAIDYCDVRGGNTAPFVVNVDPPTWGSSMINSDPLFVKGPRGLYYLSQVAAGQATDTPCLDTGSDLAVNLGMDMLWTRIDTVMDASAVDIGFHYGPHSIPWTVSFYSDIFALSQATGGSVKFALNAGLSNALRNYIIVGSLSGTSPGTVLPQGYAVLPLNWDIFTDLTLSLLNSYTLTNFLGVLDNRGAATNAQLNFPPIPNTSGLVMYFAYAVNNPWDFVSNPLVVKVTP